MTATHLQPQQASTGYILSQQASWAVIVPEATTNLLTDPSFEAAATVTALTKSNCNAAQSTTQQSRGLYSVAVTPTSAVANYVQWDLTGLTANTLYNWSLDLWSGEVFTIEAIDNATSTTLAKKTVYPSIGFWHRYDLAFQTGGGTAVDLRLTKTTPTTLVWYTDGWQLEAKAYPTTYIDGDQPGGKWNGQANTATSSRTALSAGGRIYRFDEDLGFQIVGIVGAGGTPFENVTTQYALLGGEFLQRTVVRPQTIALAGVLQGTSKLELERKRQRLLNLLMPNLLLQAQKPLTLRYQLMDGCGNPQGKPLDCEVIFVGDLTGNTDNLYQERIGLQFRILLRPEQPECQHHQ
jgi:hypothetical protein